MGFRNNCYCTIFLKDKDGNPLEYMFEKCAKIWCTIVHKESDGSYIRDFSSTVRFYGQAFEVVKNAQLEDRDKLKLISVDVVRKQGDDGKWYNNFICWECKLVNKSTKAYLTPTQPEIVEEEKAPKPDFVPIDDDTLPF